MNRKLSREEAVKILYSMDINNSFNTSTVDDHLKHFQLENLDIEYIISTIKEYIFNKEKIDSIIESYSKDWKINRIAKVDLAILRIAVTEIFYSKSIPNNVSINEAVEICKKYSSDDSHKFINGILGSIYRSLDK